MRNAPIKSLLLFYNLFILINSCSTKDEFERFELVTSLQPLGAGEVTPNEGDYSSGADVKITAIPNEGYQFKNWAGASSESTMSITLRMDSDKQITAIFEKSDSDGDGVTDDKDQCADTMEGETVDENGCSTSQVDSDGDGVTDDKDQCADTMEGETVDENGCTSGDVDGDGDGVENTKDECPNTPSGETVDTNGCSTGQKDSDGDGVNNDIDTCPGTPSGDIVDSNGCSQSQKDSDGDGVTEDRDSCPSTPSGETVDSNGCSTSQKDSDGDGVNDDSDSCPSTPSGDTVDVNGCSESQKDSDGDGVTEDRDSCPSTPSGETVDSNGCSTSQKDSDGDGVNDDSDSCPSTPSGDTVGVNGCSDGQKDTQPPIVTSFTVTDITSTSFTVDWSLDEGSKGYIQFGTSSGVYTASTNIENNYRDRHIQTIGGNNPFPLNSGTTYFWRIYTEDQYGNTVFSEEHVTTTIENVSRTYVPDDAFEQFLIDQGYDDVLDDYVDKANIKSITELRIIDLNNIDSLTGIEDFEGLLTLEIRDTFTPSLDVGKMINLENLIINYNSYYLDEYADGRPRPISRFTELDLSNNQNLSSLSLTNTLLENLDLSSNQNLINLGLYSNYELSYGSSFNFPNLKSLGFGSDPDGPGVEFSFSDINFSNLTSLEDLYLIGLANESVVIDLSNNSKLNYLQIYEGAVSGLNLKNGNNSNMQVNLVRPFISGGCIQVDDTAYSAANWFYDDIDSSVFSEDCGF